MKYFSIMIFVLSTPAAAQDWPSEDDFQALPAATRIPETSITVVASGSGQRIVQAGQSISIVGKSELDAVQGPDLTRVLERLPGVTLSRNGGMGNFTGLRVRGADAEQLLVLVDGVRVADVASPAGGTDLGGLLTGGFGKVELLRGSNSVVWGSQAMGGVLAVSTREFSGAEVSVEGGSHDTVSAEASGGLSSDLGALTLTAGHAHTDGISTAAVGTEPDAFRQWHIGSRGRLGLTDRLTATLVAHYADSRLDIDGFPPPAFTFADTPEVQTSKEASGRAGLDWRGERLTLSAGYSLSDTRRAYFDSSAALAPNFRTYGKSQRAELTGHADLASNFTLDFGADSEWSKFHTSFDAEAGARLASGHMLLGYHNGGLNLAAGARYDDHSRFGSHWTFGANGSVDLGESGWRLRASFGEGFKAPTLFQLLSDFGNAGLRPETSRAFDFGIEKGERNGRLHLAVTLFRRDSRDLIDFVSCFGVTTGICTGRPFGTYDNVGRARAEGVEVEADGRPTARLTLHAAYSWVKAVNRATGTDLARRPRHALSLSADWRAPLRDLTLGADLRVVSRGFDDAGNFVPLEGHALVTLRASLPLTERVELFGRIENVGDRTYQTAAGYGAYGRSACLGARARF